MVKKHLKHMSFCVVFLFLNNYCEINNNRLNMLMRKTRALLKGWVYKGWIQKDNLHEVIPGELYRSSQLPPSRLEEIIKNYGIKTIVNLSGDEPHYWVYQEEKKLADQYGIVLFTLKTHALLITPQEQIEDMLAISLTAPLPILVHCFAGSDRTGEMGALYFLANGKNTKEALTQLTPQYGHKKWLFPYKTYLIENLETMYPGLLAYVKRICNHRMSYQELKDVSASELLHLCATK